MALGQSNPKLAGVRRKCKFEDCGVWFKPHDMRQIYCGERCRNRANYRKLNDICKRVLGMPAGTYYRYKKNPPKKSRRSGWGPGRQTSVHVPVIVLERMKRHPQVNWSEVYTSAVLKVLERLETE